MVQSLKLNHLKEIVRSSKYDGRRKELVVKLKQNDSLFNNIVQTITCSL